MEKKVIEGKFTNATIFLILGIVCIGGAFLFARIVADASADVPALLGLILGGILIILFFVTKSCEITVTDKRIYGKAMFGKRVDLPLDSINAVGSGAFNGIAVTTASGSLSFCLMRNRDEVHNAISNLLVERQNQKQPIAQTTIKQEIPQSNADELKKYKDLIDSGVISQEEFDAKKKQLLGL